MNIFNICVTFYLYIILLSRHDPRQGRANRDCCERQGELQPRPQSAQLSYHLDLRGQQPRRLGEHHQAQGVQDPCLPEGKRKRDFQYHVILSFIRSPLIWSLFCFIHYYALSCLWFFFQEEFMPVRFYHTRPCVKIDMEQPNPGDFCPDISEYDDCDEEKEIGYVTVEIEMKSIE